jgi:uncharacterized membrane protein YeaQ/YmgE (transglycosylase-associated protein family)
MGLGAVLVIAIGVAGGWFASMYVKEDGRGLGYDLAFGVAGAIAGAVLVRIFGDGQMLSLAIAGAMGAGVTLGAQRKFWAGAVVPRVAVRARR